MITQETKEHIRGRLLEPIRTIIEEVQEAGLVDQWIGSDTAYHAADAAAAVILAQIGFEVEALDSGWLKEGGK